MSPSTPTRDSTCAIIVTYHPDEAFPERLKQVLAQLPLAIVVDNASRPSSAEMLRRLAESPQVRLVENPGNLGIAAALNQGIQLALKEDYRWVVTLDQDSQLHADFVPALFDVHLQSGGGDVMVGSNYWDVHRGRNFVECAEKGAVYRERKTLITSGTLAPLALFQNIGLFREDYFIDSVDHEFSLRARAHGYRMLISCRPLMDHSIGAGVGHTSRLRQFLSFNHSPARKYFIARNTVATAKAYFRQEPAWALRQGWRLVSDLASILLFEREKRKKAEAFMVGVMHGFAGKMGPIEKSWPDGLR
jgi:rhamnosyltransferase